MHRHPPVHLLGLLALISMLAAPGTGCHVVRSTAELPARAVNTMTPGQAGKQTVDPVGLQQTLLRVADQFNAQTVLSVEQLGMGTNALPPSDILRLKIAFVSESTAIVTGPNPLVNLLDLTVFVTVLRMSAENHWQPQVYGDAARPLLEACRNTENDIWQVAGRTLTTNQLKELRTAIENWQQRKALPGSALGARAIELASSMTKQTKPSDTQPGSVFGLLMLDPLAGMDPAVRELAQTRLFAERALYSLQKMPTLLRWQSELLSLRTTELPAVQQLVTNSTAISASLERFATVAEKLPDQVRSEREEILKALRAQEKDLAGLMNAGTDMSDSLNTTLTTFDGLMQRFGVGETNTSTSANTGTNAEPFRIQDYTATAAQLDATARQLTELLNTLDRTLDSTNLAALSDKVSPAVDRAEAGGKAVVDYAFWKGVLLILVALLAGLVYKFAAGKLRGGCHA